jgi:hypothetical protein
MKTTILFIIMSFATFCNAQIVIIPDANFKAKLVLASPVDTIAKDLTGNYFTIDANNDGEIQTGEAAQVSFLNIVCEDCSNAQQYLAIQSLEGLDSFINLKTLITGGNNLINYDLVFTNDTIIEYLDLLDDFKSITIQNTPNLTLLRFSENYNPNGEVLVDNAPGLTINFSTFFYVGLDISGNFTMKNCNQIEELLFYHGSSGVCMDTIFIENMAGLNHLSVKGKSTGSTTYYPFTINHLDIKNTPLLNSLSVNTTNIENLELCETGAYIQTMLSTANKNLNRLGLVGMPFTYINIWDDHSDLETICVDDNNYNIVKTEVIEAGLTVNVTPYCSFNPCGTFYTIQGKNTLDLNENGCDDNDLVYPALKYRVVSGTATTTVISDTTGNYSINVRPGNHVITPIIENPDYYTISPASLVVDFPNQSSPVNQDFCISAIPHHDVEVLIIPTDPARPGFDAHYTIIYKNKGNIFENGSINLEYDESVLDYISSFPLFANQASGLLTWNYSDLQPLETRSIDLVLNVNTTWETPPVHIGDHLIFTATITPIANDEYAPDNTSELNQTVVGSYDPNDKTCTEGTRVGTDMINQYVHYVIRFENTGTYAAQNIVVKDMIDTTKLDINTLVPMKGSHSFETRIQDNQKVEFIFDNINLPFEDDYNDGFVAFKIKIKPTLVMGDTFSNSAAIYFDYNEPITTNNYVTTIQNPVGCNPSGVEEVRIYPNPVKDILQFRTNESITKIEVYDYSGRRLSTYSVYENKADLSKLKRGYYFIKIYTEKGISHTRIIKE